MHTWLRSLLSEVRRVNKNNLTKQDYFFLFEVTQVTLAKVNEIINKKVN